VTLTVVPACQQDTTLRQHQRVGIQRLASFVIGRATKHTHTHTTWPQLTTLQHAAGHTHSPLSTSTARTSTSGSKSRRASRHAESLCRLHASAHLLWRHHWRSIVPNGVPNWSLNDATIILMAVGYLFSCGGCSRKQDMLVHCARVTDLVRAEETVHPHAWCMRCAHFASLAPVGTVRYPAWLYVCQLRHMTTAKLASSYQDAAAVHTHAARTVVFPRRPTPNTSGSRCAWGTAPDPAAGHKPSW
jgi:hypothetical protein